MSSSSQRKSYLRLRRASGPRVLQSLRMGCDSGFGNGFPAELRDPLIENLLLVSGCAGKC
jgi:hypothetical protein